LTFFSFIIVCSLFLGLGEATFAQQPIVPIQEHPTIQVVVQTSTWKTRGRLLYDVEGSILKKLSLAGFQAVQDKKKPHQYQLVVQYEEKRGAQYGVELWGTIIHASFLFRGAKISEPLTWEIQEASTNTVSGPAPYLDALLKFETHPHYFFLGSMLQKMTMGVGSQPEALTQAVTEFVLVVYPTIAEAEKQDGVRVQDHFMENSQRVYQEVALQRALDELVHQDIPTEELVPIAEPLLKSTDPHSRLRAVQILGGTQDATLREKIRKLATEDPSRAVRQAAREFAPL
jgi:hypothetical protein